MTIPLEIRYLFLASLSIGLFQSCLESSEPGTSMPIQNPLIPIPAPWIPLPIDHATNQSNDKLLLSWQIPQTVGQSDVEYFVSIDTVNPPQADPVAVGSESAFLTDTLRPGATYYWKVGYRSQDGLVQGPVWRFTASSVFCIDASVTASGERSFTVDSTRGYPDAGGIRFTGKRSIRRGEISGNMFVYDNVDSGILVQSRYGFFNGMMMSVYDTSAIADSMSKRSEVFYFQSAAELAKKTLSSNGPLFAIDGCIGQQDTTISTTNAMGYVSSISVRVNRKGIVLEALMTAYKASERMKMEYSFSKGIIRYYSYSSGFMSGGTTVDMQMD